MTVLETLTEEQRISLEDAQNKVTVEMLNSLENGEEIKLNDLYTLYSYIDDDCIVIVLTEEWVEVLQVLYDSESVVFEAL
jgi:hypothetical protein